MQFGTIVQFGTSLSSLAQSLIKSFMFDSVDFQDYPSRGYHELYTVQRCVDVPYTLTKWYQEPDYDKQWQKIGVECTIKGEKQNKNKSKSWKIGEIKYRQNITCWNYNQKGHFQNKCSKVVASRVKVINMAVGDSDDALVCCVENTVEDHIMDFGASFHATYCKEELERIGMSMLAFKGNVLEVRKLDIYFYKPGGFGKQKNLSFIMSVKTRKLQRSYGRYNANLQFGVAKRFSQTFIAKSMRLRAEAPNMLWADSISMAYLIYCMPYVLIGLRIPEEEWRGKDNSLAHLKVFGCDSFVKVKNVCGEAMKCTFIGDDSNEIRYSFWDTKSHQNSQVALVDIPENLAKNDSIVVEYGLSSKITQSPGRSSDTSEGSKNYRSFEDSGRSDEEYYKDRASSKEGGSETPHVRRSNTKSKALVRYYPLANYLLLTRNGKPESYLEALNIKESVQWKKAIIEEMISLEKNPTCSLVRILAGKKAS
uniref:Zinc finger, CCHC-type n=1 Tax=Tanacetum cinerariifolium TaxID=118510 RepID=A0A6L2KSD8_TANCI|nr:hypothetical protein [Tanacetum cinerariifolium]